MNIPAKIIFAITISVLSFSGVHAQASKMTTASSSTSIENTITTKNGDVLCVLSNGNEVPCEFRDILVKDNKYELFTNSDGVRFCYTTDSIRYSVPCEYLESDGKLSPDYPKTKNNVKHFYYSNYNYIKITMLFLLVILLLVATIFIGLKLYKKLKK